MRILSPHILIDQALDGVATPFGAEDISLLVQALITRLFTDGAITTALLDLDHPDSTVHAESLVERLVVGYFTAST
jgi:hypothetical protein